MSRGTPRRPRPAPRSTALLLAALVLLSAPVTAVAQPFLARYKAGIEAADRGDWNQVVSHMRAAIQDRPEEASRLVAHFHFRPYVPHYYLGLGLAEQGDCAAALQALDRSESQGVIRELEEEYARLRQVRDRCRQQLRQTAELVQQAEEAVGIAGERLEALAAAEGTAELADWWRSGSPSPRASREQASRWLEEARELLDDDPARALELAQRAASAAAGLQAEAEAEVQRLQAQRLRREARSGLESVRQQARRALAGVRDLRPYPEQLGRLAERVERLLARSEQEGLDVQTLVRLEGELREATAALSRAAQPPPERFVAAAEAFLAGRYGEVLAILPEDGLPRGRARAFAHLLRGAALFALARSGGTGEPAPQSGSPARPRPARGDDTAGDDTAPPPALPADLRQAARREVEAALAAEPGLAPPARFHSPSFLALVEEVRAAGSPEQAPPSPP